MNPVFVLLNDKISVKLSVRTLAKRLNMTTKCVLHHCFKDPRIRRVRGIEVGTGKSHINVFTIDH